MKKFLSRKLLAFLATGLVAALGQRFGLDAQTIDIISTAAVAYILGQAAVDTVTAFKTPTVS